MDCRWSGLQYLQGGGFPRTRARAGTHEKGMATCRHAAIAGALAEQRECRSVFRRLTNGERPDVPLQPPAQCIAILPVMLLSVAVRAESCNVIQAIRAFLAHRHNMVDFQIGASVDSSEQRCRAARHFTGIVCPVDGCRNHVGVASKLCSLNRPFRGRSHGLLR